MSTKPTWDTAMEKAVHNQQFLEKLVLYAIRVSDLGQGSVMWCIAPVLSDGFLGEPIACNHDGPTAVLEAINLSLDSPA